MISPLAVGDAAPDFALSDQNGVRLRLSELRASTNVLVVFFPFAFSGICTGELGTIRDHLGDFVTDDLQTVCLSCDPVYTQRAWADQHSYFFPLLSDFWPHGAAARSFGVFDEQGGFAIRGTFLIDRAGIVRWTQVNLPGQGRELRGFRDTLAAL